MADVSTVITNMLNHLHLETKGLSGLDYKDVLEELIADFETRLECLENELEAT